MNLDNNKANLMRFFTRLVAIAFSIIGITNIIINLIFAEKFGNINKTFF